MDMLKNMLDLKNTFEGKFLAVLMSVVLVMSMTNILAFAGNEGGEGEEPAVEAPPVEEVATDSDKQAVGEAVQHGEEAAAEDASVSPEAPSEPLVSTTVDEAVVTFETEYAFVTVKDQVLSGTALATELHKELRFSASADTGFELASIKAKNAANADVPVSTQDGISTIAAEFVDSTLVVTVAAEPVAADEPEVETTPITSDTKIDSVTDEVEGVPAQDGDGSEADAPKDPAVDEETVEVEADVSNPAFEGYAQAGDVLVKVTAADGVLPAGTTVQAVQVDRQDILDAVSEKVESQGKVLEDAVAVDVTLLDKEGNELQPEGAVNVCFFDALVQGEEIGMYRVSDDASAVETIGARQADAAVQSFDVDHFTIYVVAAVGDKQVVRKADTYETVAVGESIVLASRSEDGTPYAEMKDSSWTVVPESQDVIGLSEESESEATVTGLAAGSVVLNHVYEYRLTSDSNWISGIETVHVTVVGEIEAEIALYDELNEVTSGGSQHIKSGSLMADVHGNVVPSLDGYYYMNATVGDVVVSYVERRGDGVYYSVDGDMGSGVGVKLDDGESVVLNYRALGNKVAVHYETTGRDDVSGNQVVGFPSTVEKGAGFNFKVEHARGYEVAVTRGGKPLSGSADGTYAIDSVTEETTIVVEFKQIETVTFDTEWWNSTVNTQGRYVMNEPTANNGSTVLSQPVGDDGANFTFDFRTKVNENITWQLDSFNINDKYLAIPTREVVGASESTVLYSDESGECVATVTLVEITRPNQNKTAVSCRYRIDITGAKENLEIKQANLNNVTWKEVIPTASEGLEFFIAYENGSETPVPVVPNKPYQTNIEQVFLFKPAIGYKNLQVTMQMMNVNGVTLFREQIALPEEGKYVVVKYKNQNRAAIEKRGGVYYVTYFQTAGNSQGVTLQFMNITCERVTYGVSYDSKEGSGSIVDSRSYDTVSNTSAVVVGQIPDAPDGKFFKGWKIRGDASDKLYYVGDRIDFTDSSIQGLLQKANDLNDGNLVLEAQYASELTQGEAVIVPVNVHILGKDGQYATDSAKSFSVKSALGKTVHYLDIPQYEGYAYESDRSTTSVVADGRASIDLYYSQQFEGFVSLDDWTYNGQFDVAGSLTSSTTGGGYGLPTYYYKGAGEADGSYTVEQPVDAGSYVVKAVWEATEYCAELSATDEFLIRKAPVTISVDDKDKKFGDNDPVFTGSVENLVAEGDLGEVAYQRTNSDQNVGEYLRVLTATYTENDNYEVQVNPGNFKITPQGITADAPSDVVYNGQEQKQAPVVTGEDGGRTLVEGVDYELTYSGDVTNAGSVTVTVTGIGNYEGTIKLEYEITPLPIEITAGSLHETYNGSAWKVEESSITSASKLVGGATYSVTFENNERTDVGRQDVLAKDAVVSGDKTENYAFTYMPGSIKIDPASLKAQDPEDVVYNGQEQKQAPLVTDASGKPLVEGVDYRLTYSDDVTNAGTVTVTVIGIGNYAGAVDCTYSITPAPAEVLVDSTSKIFGADDPVFTGIVSGLFGEDSLGTITYSRTNDANDVGTYVDVLTATVTELNPNYTYTVELGDFSIVPASGNFVNAKGVTKTYDGQSATVTASADKTGSTLLYSLDGETWTDEKPSFTDAGTYTVHVKATNPNFDETPTVSATVVIEKRAASIKVDSTSKKFGDNDPVFTGSVENLVAEGDLGEVAYQRTNSDQNVGEYLRVLTATYTENDNYEVQVNPGNFKITPQGITADAPSDVVYNGQEQKWIPQVLGEDGSVLVQGVDYELTYSGDVTNAGTVTVTVTGIGNYTGTVDRAYEIIPAKVEIVVDGKDKTFGAPDPEFSGLVTGVVEGEDLHVSYARANDDVGKENVGDEIKLVATYAANPNYSVTMTPNKLEIKPQGIAVGSLENVVYNGQEQKQAPAVTGETDGRTLFEGVDYVMTYSGDVTNVGTVTVTVTGIGNYEGMADRAYLITPASAKVIVSDSSKKYDQADPAFSGSVEGLFGSDKLGDVVYSRTNAAEEHVGTYIGVLTATVDNLNPNYTYTVEPGTFTIDASDANLVRITTDAEGLTKTYDGQPSSISAEADVEGSTLLYSVDGGTTWSEENPSFTDAGSYTVHVKATREGYEETAPVSATIVINQAPVTITVTGDSKVFGEADPAFGGTVEGLVAEGDLGEVSYQRTNSNENVGTYADVLTASYTENANYAVTVVNGTFEITPQTIDADTPNNVVYNGQEQIWSPNVVGEDGRMLEAGEDYTVSYEGDVTNAGTVKVVITGIGNFTGSVERTYEITPAEATIRVNNDSKVYGTDDPNFEGVIEGLFGNDKLGDVSYSRTNDAEEAGTYEGVLTAAVANANPNYTYTVKPGNFTIAPAGGNIVSATGLTKTYDRRAVSVAATTAQPGSTLLYSLDGEEWSEENPTFVDAGTYEVYVKATNPNFDDTPVVTADVLIHQAPVTITVADASKEYDSDDPVFKGTIEGLIEPDSLDGVSYRRTNDAENAGTYVGVLTATVDKPNPNYIYTVVPGTFTIKPTDGNAVSATGSEKTYDGQAESVTAAAAQPGSTLLYSVDGENWSETNPSFVDADTYTVYVKAVNPNYNETEVANADVVINQAPVTITVADASKKFGGEEPRFGGTVEGLVAEGDLGEVAYQRTNSDENVGEYAAVLTASYRENANYEVTVNNGDFKITPQAIAANDPSDVVYNGREQKWSPKVTGEDDGRTLVEGVDYVLTYSDDVTNVGTVTVTVTGIGNYEGMADRAYLITPASAKVIVSDSSKKYDQADPAFSGSVEGLFGSDKLGDVVYSRTNAAEEHVGTYIGVLTATVDNLNPNYTYTVEPGTFTIDASDANLVRITTDAEGLTKTYDGQPSSISAEADVEGSTLLYSVDGGTTWSEENPSFTDAGSYTVHVKATREGYEETAPVSATIVINQAPVTITVADASKKFGGEEPRFGGTVEGLVAEGDLGEVGYVRPGGAENVGVYPGALTALYTPNANYAVTVVNGTFEITPQTIDADTPNNVVYDGQEQKWSPKVTGEDGSVLVEGVDYTVTYSSDATNVGTVSVTIVGAGNYAGTVDRTYNITPAAATIRVNGASKVYGAADPAFTGAIEGLFGADVLGTVTYARSNDAEEVGTYADVLTAAVTDPNPNYTFTVIPGSFAIEPADGNVVRVDGLTKVYDGVSVTVTAEADQPGSTLLYSLDGETWVEASPSFTDAGVYVVQVKATNPNFEETAAVSANVVINKAPVTIAVTDASKVAGETDPVFTGTVEGLVAEGDLGEVTFLRANAEEAVGVYADVLVAQYADNANYEVTVVPGTFTIAAPPTTPVAPTPVTPGTTPPAGPVTPTPLPTPGTPPADNPLTPVVAPIVDALATAAETVIGDNATPLAQGEPRETEIGDNETPLAGSHPWCWVHWYIILGIIVSAVYAAFVALRRGLFSHKLKTYEDDLTGGGDPAPGAPSVSGGATTPIMPQGMPAGATLASGLGK